MKKLCVILLWFALVGCTSTKMITMRISGDEVEITPPFLSGIIGIKGKNIDIVIVREAIRKADKIKVPKKSSIKVTSEEKEITIKPTE